MGGLHRKRRCPVCRAKLPATMMAKGCNPCRACRRLMTYLLTVHKYCPAQPPRILRPVRCRPGRD